MRLLVAVAVILLRVLMVRGAPTGLGHDGLAPAAHNVSIELFAELEELARIVDISYCVGMTGIQKPFECLGRCGEFEGYELVDTWNTGPLMSDSCGYIVVDHNRERFGKGSGRIIAAFRGTYSLANTIVDLSTVPQEYVPYPGDPEKDDAPVPHWSYLDLLPHPLRPSSWLQSRSSFLAQMTSQPSQNDRPTGPKCTNCTVHSGFFTSYKNTRTFILPLLASAHDLYPDYSLHLVGHSLGGAVALLSALEFETLGWNPTITTFGEPRVGNTGLRDHVDEVFSLTNDNLLASTSGDINVGNGGRYRRLTHIDDPVPLLPLSEWSYRPHAGEIYISKPSLPPMVSDFRLCEGDEDGLCIEGADSSLPQPPIDFAENEAEIEFSESDMPISETEKEELRKRWGFEIDSRYKMWQLFFAHRDYFWRLGLCVPGGDPLDWGGRHRYGNFSGVEGGEDET